MAIIESKGLKGMRRVGDLSKEEYDAFIEKNRDMIAQHGYDPVYINNLYSNKQYIDKYGIDDFKAHPNIQARNKRYEDDVTVETFDSVYKDDKDYRELASGLDVQGMRDLLTNEDYIGTVKREQELKEGMQKAKSDTETQKATLRNPFVPAYVQGALAIDVTRQEFSPIKKYEDSGEKDKEIREKLFAETQERREQQSKPVADNIFNSWVEEDERGGTSLADRFKEFDNFANNKEVSPHYAAFRNSEWLKNYSNTDRLKEYAMYQAIAAQYGEGVARQYLDRTIQNRVAEEEDGKWTGNTLKKIGTTIWSDLGSNVGMFSYIGKSPEEIGILNQGLDPNKPLYNEKGELVGYEPIESIWKNPAYWNDVYKYNAYTPEEIALIKERGGISEHVNVRKYGHTPEFLSWETAQEAAAQSGHIAAFGIETGLLGIGGKALGAGMKAGMKGLQLSAETANALSKAGRITRDIFTAVSAGMSGSQMEAMGAFDEELQKNKDKIEEQKRHELQEYYNSIDYSTPEAKAAMASYYDQLKREDNRRVAQAGENEMRLPQSDNVLLDKAKELYTQSLLQAKTQELEELHKKDEFEAAKDAGIGYGTALVMNIIKNAPLDMLIQKFKFTKGSISSGVDNAIQGNIVQDIVTGGIKRNGARLTSAKNLAKESAKLVGGGFVDEWGDGVNASFAEGVNDNEFRNYINRTYNPEAYNAAVDGLTGNFLSGLVSGLKGTLDEQNLYEGSIGAIAPFASVMVNPNAAFHPKDTWNAIANGTSADGDKLNIAERMSSVLSNPLLNTYADLREKDRVIDKTVDVVNKYVAEKRGNFDRAAEIIAALSKKNNPINKVIMQDDEENTILPSLLDSKDGKLQDVFVLIDNLKELSSMQGGAESAIYQQTMETLQGLADGTLSEEAMNEEIDRFLADEDNKSVVDQSNKREVAAERLQKNAQYFIQMMDKMDDIYGQFAKSPAMKNVDPRVQKLLAWNLLSEEDYKNRLTEIEEQYGVGKTDPFEMYVPNFQLLYGTKESRNKAIVAREKTADKLQKDKEAVQQKIDNLQNEIKKTEREKSSKEKEDKLQKQKHLLSSLEFQKSTLSEQEQLNADEISSLRSLASEDNVDVVLTETDILNADARDRAEILNPQNRNRYSKKQQKVIEHVEKKLAKTPGALRAILDAGVLANRIADVTTTYNRINNNNELAAVYLNAVENQRTRAAVAESIEDGIEQHYSKIENAYNKAFNPRTRNKERRKQEFKDAILNASSKVIQAYMEDHPEQADNVQPYFEISKLLEDASAVIVNSSALPDNKRTQIKTLFDIVGTANNKDEIISALEKVVDDTDGSPAAKDFEELLSGLEQLGYKRDNTVVETRKQRREREAKQKKEAEEAKKRLDEERRKVAEKAAQEIERKKKEEEERKKEDELKKAQESKVQEAEDTEEIKPNAEFTEGEKGTLDLGEEQQNQENPVINNMGKIVDDGQGNSMAVSPTLEEQAREDKSDAVTIASEESLEDPESTNANVGDSNETRDNTFSGNAMGTYHIVPNEQQGVSDEDSLKYGGKLTRKKGENNPKTDYITLPDGTKLDKRNRFNRWMEQTMGIKLDNIISRELNQIIAANPNLKIKFLTVRGRNLKTQTDELDDNTMKSHLLLVVDYDNNVNKNIESIHSDDNGGVLESNGKKYLVVGVAGFGDINNQNNSTRRDLYDDLYSNLVEKEGNAVLRQESKQFFANNPTERFYVSPNYATEAVPMSLIPGWIVKRLEADESTANRKVSELLFDSEGNPNNERNPEGLTWKDLSWGIQKDGDFLHIKGRKFGNRAVMKPQKDVENQGRVFLLIPASNGKLVPSYIVPANYTNLQDGSLKDRITDIVNRMTAPVAEDSQAYTERLNALRELSKIFYFSKDGNNILLSKDGSTLTFVKGAAGVGSALQAGTIRFTDTDVRERFFELLRTLDPRVNITADVLMDTDRLKEYDEAGALRTDAALLHTAGSSYSIWAVDKTGKMLKPASVENPTWSSLNDRNVNRKSVFYNGTRYSYNRDNATFYDEFGNVITDESLIEELNYNRQIADGELESSYTRGEWSYYLLEEGEHPKAIKVHSSTKKVTKATEEEAKKLVDKINAEKEKEARKQAAEKQEEKEKDLAQTLPSIELGIDAQTGDVVAQSIVEKEQQGEETKPNPTEERTLENTYKATSPTQSFETMLKGNKELRGNNETLGLDNRGVLGLISDVFEDSPIKFNDKGKLTKSVKNSEVAEFLRGKNVEVDAIGTSKEDISAWVETLKNCR